MDSSQGRIASLHLNVGHREPLETQESVNFLGSEGIEGDRHVTTRPERSDYQVLLMEKETLDALDLDAGAVRENVTTVGVDLAALSPGQRLALGDSVLLRVSKPCAPCSRMDEIRPGLQEQLEGRRGMLASVERGGSVKVGDRVRVA